MARGDAAVGSNLALGIASIINGVRESNERNAALEEQKRQIKAREELFTEWETLKSENLDPVSYGLRVKKAATLKGFKPGPDAKETIEAYTKQWETEEKNRKAESERKGLTAGAGEKAENLTTFRSGAIEPAPGETSVPYTSSMREVKRDLARGAQERAYTETLQGTEGLAPGDAAKLQNERVTALEKENKERLDLATTLKKADAYRSAEKAPSPKESRGLMVNGGWSIEEANKAFPDIKPEEAKEPTLHEAVDSKTGKGVFIQVVNGVPRIVEGFRPEEKKAPQTIIDLSMKGQEKGTEAGIKVVTENKPLADASANVLKSINEARKLQAKGVKQGFGASYFNTAANVVNNLFGLNIQGEKLANSQALEGILGTMAAANLKPTFGGGQITEGEREFVLRNMGNINTDPEALNNLLDFYEAKARSAIREHNRMAAGVEKYLPFSMQVEEPPTFKKAAKAQELPSNAPVGTTATDDQTGEKYIKTAKGWEKVK